jgi:hypothetical protein
MLDDVADIASITTIAKPVPTSPDTRAALRYLQASGANAISITCGAGHVVLGVGYRADAVTSFWLPADKARAVAARARKIKGDAGDVEAVVGAVLEAALQLRVTLTEHDSAISRAGAMAARLDEFMHSLKGGPLKEFNKQYKLKRQTAFAKGEQFMKYPIALARLRSAMIPVLMNNGNTVVGASIFAEVFDT